MLEEGSFEELVDECYICMAPCKTKSPCKCATVVHSSCLEEFRMKSGHDECTICLDKYPQTVSCSRVRILTISFGYLIIYLTCGVIGQFILALIKHDDLADFVFHPPWSVEFIIAALCICSMSGFITCIVKKYSV